MKENTNPRKAIEQPTKPNHRELNTEYIVTTDNVEIGTILLGTYTCESPEAAVRAVVSGNYQSPPNDPAYEIAAENASNFTVYELSGKPTTVSRTDA